MKVTSRLTCCGMRAQKPCAVTLLIAMLVTIAVGPGLAPVARAQAGPASVGFLLDAGDLRFIFRQIQIAQAHAAGGQLLGPGPNQVNERRLPLGLRTVDGSFNHLTTGQTQFGAADRRFPRLTTPVYRSAQPFDPDGPGPAPATPTSYTQKSGVVSDPEPRIISNLIVDQTAANPAAVAAAGEEPEVDPDSGTIFIPNVASDAGLSAPFNSMFTFFGQFFDHGLDLVNKGGSGVVFIPLQPDDPLFVAPTAENPNPPNFMVLTRATNQPGPDGQLGTADDVQEATNQTTPFVDQNQTYTSHPAHQVFLREYTLNAANRPVATGQFIDGGGTIGGTPVRNIGTWAEVKAQARTMLGIALTDADVFNAPLVATDPYGRFLRGPNGFPLLMQPNNQTTEGNPDAPISTTGALRTGHAFLDDIGHNAAPAAGLVPDEDTVANPIDTPRPQGTYDDELLDAHFCTGDGRGNENIALTAVHTVFHAEHNRLANEIPTLIDSATFGLTQAERDAWKAVDPASGWDYGERLFQAARFVTEMQYQHLVFEEFARKMSPTINVFIADGINFQSDTNPAISAEFAHQAYRLGHSMLTEVIARTNENGSSNDIGLLEGFLNPLEFNDGGPAGRLTAAQAAGSIFQGMARQVGNDIDEFVTEAVRNNLLGLPLDLAVLNLARGRSEGVAPLNAVRRQLFEATGDSQLTPYDSWNDFKFNMKHQESLVNFIAAYGIHSTLQAPGLTLAQRRTAAQNLLVNTSFMNGPASETGVDRIDLWMGGLAEKISPFGGMLGTTFNYIFELTLENLQNADRFYYLERLDGLNLLAQMEGNSFSELISRNTTAKGAAADVFARPDFVFNLTSILRTPGVISDDPSTPENEGTLSDLVLLPNGTVRYLGPAHVIFNGRSVADRIVSSEGDDTIRGDDGNDVIEGGAGNDSPIGGAGDDILMDTFGEDVIKGGPGNDAISGGSGPFDLLQGNEGHDYIVGGNDVSEVFGGSGNDIIFTGEAATEAFGGGGDDWIEGGPQLDLLVGDENNQFQDDPNGGHDVISGGKGDDDYDSEGGDDVMIADVLGTERLEGMLGFDWATYRGDALPVDADMSIRVVLPPNLDELRDRFDLTEGLSGFMFNDLLAGDDRVAADQVGHELTPAHVARVAGLNAVLGGAPVFTDGKLNLGGNIILGGGGSDRIEGAGGNDIIDGDAWLNVQLEAPDPRNGFTQSVDSLKELRTDVFAGRINPGAIQIRRSIIVTGADTLDFDTAVFSGAEDEYTITPNADGSVDVDHTGGNGADGRDRLRNIERLEFTDGTREITSTVRVTVPNVVGRTVDTARTTLANAELSAGTITFENSPTIAAGNVISQTPNAGTTGVTQLTAVALVVSLGRANVQVPGLMGMTQAEAAAALADAELGLGNITTEPSTSIGKNLVIRSNPLVGVSVPPGTAVALVISSGFPTVLVPGLVGLTEPEAVTALDTAGMTVGTVTREFSETIPAGVVISQDPQPEGTAAPGSQVSFVVSRGPVTVEVPTVVGLPEASAKDAITTATLIVGTITTATSTTVDAGNVISQNPAAGIAVAPGSSVSLVISTGSGSVTVPNVVGMLQAAATTALGNVGLTVGTVTQQANAAAVGTVLTQDPAASASVAPGSAVALTVSSGPAAVTVPNVVGMLQAAATTALGNVGLTVGTVTQQANAAAVGTVLTQNPAANASAAPGSAVALTVSSGPAAVNVPNVTGQVEATARTNITNAGLVAGTSTAENSAAIAAGSVIRTAPTAGTSVPSNSTVNLVVSSGPAVVNVNVPNVTGQVEATARTNITNAGLVPGTTSTENHATIASGSIIRTAPAAGTSVLQGSTVNLVRSLGPATSGNGPVSVPPVEQPDLSGLPSTTVPVRVTWSATAPAGTTIARYEVQRSTNNGTSWTAETLSSPTSTVKTMSLTPGTSYRFRVRAVDSVGTVGEYATAGAFTVAVRQETLGGVSPTVPRLEFTTAAAWTNETVSTASGGAQRFASAAGASATFTFTGRSVAWAAVKANNRGRAQVFVDGVSAATIDLFQSSTTPTNRVMVFRRTFPAGGTHTIEVRALGTKATASTGTRVDVDAFVTTDGPTSAPVNVAVPNVVNQTEANARTAITSANLVVGAVTTANHASIVSGNIISSNPAAGASVAAGSTVTLVRSLGPATQTVTVPNVVNQTEANARTAITNANLVVGAVTTANHATIVSGNIISSNPAAGASVASGSTVTLVRSLGAATQTVTVPNVVNQTEANARTAITNANLVVGAVTTANHATIVSGNIISSNPAAGASAAVGSSVALVRSLGPAAAGGPVSTAPVEQADLSALASSTVPMRVTWSATPASGSTIARYEVERSTNNGTSWTAETLSSATATGKTLSLTPGTSYRFRVRAVDDAGRVGAYATAAAFTVAIRQENLGGVSPTVPRLELTTTPAWTNETVTTASGGAQRFASAANAIAKFTFTGRSVAWATVKANSRGRAEVFVDGVSAGTIDLFQSSTTAANRVMVFRRTFPTAGTHTIEVRVLGTKATASTGTRVDVDAFVTTQ